MAEYSRLVSGTVVSNGGATPVVIPFLPDSISIFNRTRAVAGAGVTNASWAINMGQGAAELNTFGTGIQFIAPVGQASSGALVSGTGFTTIQAGLALQYGPSQLITGITAANPAVITSTSAHNLVSGNVVIFQNLYETSTTGMQQIAGIPFVVTVLSPTTFSIDWDASGANYTAITTSGFNSLPAFKKVLYPVLYAPGVAFVAALGLGSTTAVTTTAPHNYVVGQEVAFRIPSAWGTIQLNSLPNVLIPGSPIYGYVVAVGSSTTFTVNIDSSAFTAFNVNQPFLAFRGEQFPQVVAVGDVNTGGYPISAGSDLYPSPLIYNGFGVNQVRTINGPAIQGAYINATFQGFIIGSSIAGTAADVIYWEARLMDKNYP